MLDWYLRIYERRRQPLPFFTTTNYSSTTSSIDYLPIQHSSDTPLKTLYYPPLHHVDAPYQPYPSPDSRAGRIPSHVPRIHRPFLRISTPGRNPRVDNRKHRLHPSDVLLAIRPRRILQIARRRRRLGKSNRPIGTAQDPKPQRPTQVPFVPSPPSIPHHKAS